MHSHPIRSLVALSMCSLLFVGCATSPSRISSSYVSPIEYSHLECEQIRRELVRVNRRLMEVTGTQKSAATKDAVAMGVGLVVFWPALFFIGGNGNKEELARLKGQYEALETVAIEKNCGYADELNSAKAERERLEAEAEAEAAKEKKNNRGKRSKK